MKTIHHLILGIGVLAGSPWAAGQSIANLDLSTRCVGVPPVHQTVSSAARWIQDPLQQKLEIAVTNLYAATNAYMEIDIAGRQLIFYGAGQDSLGNYIPTNYAPVEVDATLRRKYLMNIMCPNNGAYGGPLFQLNEFPDPPSDFITYLTNTPTDEVSAYLWANFTPAGQYAITNVDSSPELVWTNLVEQLNQILKGPSIYNAYRFSGVTLSANTEALLNADPPPQGQDLILLNHLLLHDAYQSLHNYWLTTNEMDNYSGTAQIQFYVQPPPELKISKAKLSAQYSVLINGIKQEDYSYLSLQRPPEGDVSTNYSVVEVLKDKFAHFGLGDGCDDATKAPGQGTWLSMGPGCTRDTNRISLSWSVSLGRTFDGLAAGQLGFRESFLTRDSYTPKAIYYNGSMTNLYAEMPLGMPGSPFVPTNLYASVILVTTNVPWLTTNSAGEICTNFDTVLRQIKSCQTFVDILVPDTNRTVLNFYLSSQVGTNQDGNGLYTNITNSPFVSWTIQNPDPSSTSNLLIIENRSGSVSTQSLAETASVGGVTWTLTQGSGPETRVESRVVSFEGSPATDRVELNTVKYANSNAPAYQCQETYHFYPWGSELAQTSIPNNNYVTSYDYYTNTAPTPDDPEALGYKMIREIDYPDGYWEKRIYGYFEGWIPAVQIFHPDLACRPFQFGGELSLLAPCPDNVSAELVVMEGNVQWVAECPQGEWAAASASGRFNWGGCVQSVVGAAWPMVSAYFELLPTDPNTQSSTCALDHNINLDFSDDNPPGLAGHATASLTPLYKRFQYYDHGVFNPSTCEFALNMDNHLYTWDGITNKYPDHQQTRIDLPFDPRYYEDPAGEIAPPIPGVLNPPMDYYTSVDDHPLPDQLLGLPFHPGATRKGVQIYHAGSLAQTEDYVYFAPGSYDPQWALLSKVRYYVDSLGRLTNATLLDPVSTQTRILYTADYRGDSGYDGELLLSEKDENGRQIAYVYDSLQRVKMTTIKGYGTQPDQTNSYTYDANGRIISQTTTAGSLSMSQSWAFDLVGRQTNHVNTSGIATQTTYSTDNLTITTTSPGNIQVIQQQGVDRFPVSVQGNGTIAKFYTHDTTLYPMSFYTPNYGGMLEQTTYFGSVNSPRWVTYGTDVCGNSDAYEVWPVGEGTTNTASRCRLYGSNRLLDEEYNYGTNLTYYSFLYPENMTYCTGTSHGYDENGICLTSVWAHDSDISRMTASLRNTISLDGKWYAVTTNVTYLDDVPDWQIQSSDMVVQSIHLEQLNGFTGDAIACAKDYDADGNETITTTYLDRANNEVTIVTSKPNTSTLNATDVYQNGRLVSSSTLSVASPTLYFYDALGRTNRIQSPLGCSVYMSYDPGTGWLTSMTDPAGNTTSYSYYSVTEANAGKLKCQTNPAGKKTCYAYTTRGELYRTWGDMPYPAEYHYSEYGDLTNLITFRGGSGWNGSSWPANPGVGENTYWIYDEASGALRKKIDAQGHATTYTHYPESGRLRTRSWQRVAGSAAVTVTNLYDSTYRDNNGVLHDDSPAFGDLVAQVYNDGTPSVLFSNYNRAGLPRQVVDATGTNDLVYDHASRLISIAGETGIYAGIAVSNHFDWRYGRDKLIVTGLSSPIENDFMYDAYGRLSLVGAGVYSATYGYLPNSDLLQTTSCYNNGNPVMTTTRSWQCGFRLSSIASTVSGSAITSHAYAYDSLNRRTQAALEDGSVWNYSYNDRDELTGAQRYWPDMYPVSGQQFGYAYDNMGNRQSATFGGDSYGGGLQTITYIANDLNQYTNIITPGCKDIIGVALATNSVTVNGGTADRKVEYYHRQIAVANSSGPVWQNVTNISGTFTNKGGLICPRNCQTLVYDEDGNLIFDGIWTYEWDGENRLISMWMTNNIGGIMPTNQFKLDFVYDFMGRRVEKIVSTNIGDGFTFFGQSTNLFVYDGWNLLAVFNPQSSVLQSFVWGNDLSGTMTQAGGVGGLLMANISGTNCFTAYDGNGNITAIINAADKTANARYEYDPYGNLLRETGLLASRNPFRFSTKFCDEESGLLYFNRRFYNPTIGQWIGRDPLGEQGGNHLYRFLDNMPSNKFDPTGMKPTDLSTLVSIAPLAESAEELFIVGSLRIPSVQISQDEADVFEYVAATMCVTIDQKLDGKLLANVGGQMTFAMLNVGGMNVEHVPRLNRGQSLGMAVVSGRLAALAAIGNGAFNLMTGSGPGEGEVNQAGYDFARSLQRGDTLLGGLDAVVLAAAIGREIADSEISGGKMAGLMLIDLLNGDAAGAFSHCADYAALNAWDMADSLQE